ncbi:unnamed protein product [Caenorhabditis sp. 36 PRJEB53466]|nr:unnamed protein product [Caenorhabditis sp. 36 PRJEB53466]
MGSREARWLLRNLQRSVMLEERIEQLEQRLCELQLGALQVSDKTESGANESASEPREYVAVPAIRNGNVYEPDFDWFFKQYGYRD